MADVYGSSMTPRRVTNDFVDSRAFEWLSRAGFVARGAVYAIIGVLALRLAVGDGGKLVNQQGAFHTVARQPLGTVLLVALAIGLGGYALWRFVRAGLGHGPEGRDSGFERVAAFASGVVYAALCVIAIQVLAGSSGSAAMRCGASCAQAWATAPRGETARSNASQRSPADSCTRASAS
ncbi:MAG TPA: DUF1206 domain-containing protein, partial [Gaiellaceae bacterium]|nr:DUF1206 domain-containing protein [Gaiellaceae bacterium]